MIRCRQQDVYGPCVVSVFHMAMAVQSFNFYFELLISKRLFLFSSLPNRKMCKIFFVAMKAFQYKPTLFTTG